MNGVSDFDSNTLRQRQRQFQQFGILSLQKQAGAVDVQASVFTRFDSLRYSPDPLGDLLSGATPRRSAGDHLDRAANRCELAGVRHAHAARRVPGADRAHWQPGHLLRAAGGRVRDADERPARVHRRQDARTGGFYGVYVQDEWRILPRVTLNYGLRGDVVDEYTHEAQLSPRVNVVWKPLDGTTLHAGYSRYFNPPPFELVGNTTITRFAGTTAQPEVLRSTR